MAFQRFPISAPRVGLHWVVVDDDYNKHDLSSAFLTDLRFGRGRAPGTVANYAGDLAMFLTWQERTGLSIKDAAKELSRFILFLRTEPIEKGKRGGGRPRAGARIEKICVAVREYYKYLVAMDELKPVVLQYLYELVDDTNRHQNHRVDFPHYQARARHKVPKTKPARVLAATDAECQALLRACLTWRDRYLLTLMMEVGLRVGQAVGLRREDQHFAESTVALGCPIEGPHLHVERREDNLNGAFSKTRHSYHVPVNRVVQTCYERYLLERDQCPRASGTDYVFVNLAKGNVGAALTANSVNQLFGRLCQRGNLSRTVTPHMLRHTMASDQVRAGTHLSVLQELLGHSSISSTQVYVHVSDTAKREAVERSGTARKGW